MQRMDDKDAHRCVTVQASSAVSVLASTLLDLDPTADAPKSFHE